jgi:hypothetical protein
MNNAAFNQRLPGIQFNDYRIGLREISIQRDTGTGTLFLVVRKGTLLCRVLPTRGKRFHQGFGSGSVSGSAWICINLSCGSETHDFTVFTIFPDPDLPIRLTYRMRNDAALACSSSPVVDSAPAPPRPSWLMSGVKGTSSLVRLRRPA